MDFTQEDLKTIGKAVSHEITRSGTNVRHADREDLVSEVIARVFEYEGEIESLPALARSIARNVLMERDREAKRRREELRAEL